MHLPDSPHKSILPYGKDAKMRYGVMDDTKLLDRIALRQKKLKAVSADLKKYFVGLDGVIDKIIGSIESWYCMPELLTRPTIVCLWGLTGNGKTDLVRRLVKSLEYHDSFVEIQMTNKGSSQHVYSNTLQSLLGSSNVTTEEPGILLLDEIQRFRSVDQDGKDIHDYHFQDLWMLLSDGSFGSASDNKQQLLEMMLEAIYWEDYQAAKKAAAKASGEEEEEDDEDEDKDIEKRRKFKMTYWHSRQLKKKLRLTESVEEIMKWDSSKKMQILTQKMNDKSIYRPEAYSKLLVFISGNLDEAYRMADQTDETDVDAEVFHKHSLRINLLGIKGALRSRFKPEQIARFGNTHVIYPALSRDSYETIIRRKVQEVLDQVKETAGISINPDKSVYDAIYRNGVFPVQGTRPVFSTISSFFEASLPSFTLKALQTGVDKFKLHYDNTEKYLWSKIAGEVVKVVNEGDIDKIKEEKRNEHLIRKVATHEAGHAITYSMLFGVVPTQVTALVASDDRNGFIGIHAIDSTKNFLQHQITCLLAGRVAEELVFGKDNVNGGASGDIDRATTLAGSMVRMYGMGNVMSKVVTPNAVGGALYHLGYNATNEPIEQILQNQKKEAENLLRSQMPLLKELSDYLIKNEKIDSKDYIPLFKKHGIKVEFLDAKEVVFPDYEKMYSSHWVREKESRKKK